MKFGCCTNRRNYKLLEKIGYDYIEFSGTQIYHLEEPEFQALVEEVRGGIPCLGFNSYAQDTPVMVRDAFQEELVRAYAQKIMKRGHLLGIKTVWIGAPSLRRLDAGYARALARRQCCRFLQIVCEEAEKYNIDVLFEALNRSVCDFVTDTHEALDIVKSLSPNNLFLVLDFYHMNVMGEDLLGLEDVHPYTKHVHLSHRGEHDKREYLKNDDRTCVRNIFTALRKLGYDSTVSIKASTDDFARTPQSLFGFYGS